jgi:hypothetical protein
MAAYASLSRPMRSHMSSRNPSISPMQTVVKSRASIRRIRDSGSGSLSIFSAASGFICASSGPASCWCEEEVIAEPRPSSLSVAS